MQYVTLGKTGLKISKIGLGGIPIQRTEVEQVKKLIQEMIKRQINFIDTARGYTVSEGFLGEALEGVRQHFVLATKSMARTKKEMGKDINSSLYNLKTDYIDLYQVHNPSISQLEVVTGAGGALEAMMEAKKEGKIGHIGITAHSIEVFRQALELSWVETIMFPYNIVESQAEELMKECRRKKIGFIDMKPMAGGAIEDSALALRYISSNPDVTVVIPGMYRLEELEENIEAVEREDPLSSIEIEKIRKVRKQLGSNFCRRCGYCAPCTQGIDIPNVFLFAGYLERYGLEKWARERYASLSVKASSCIECGICETRCPYELPIRQMLKKSAEEFE